MENRKPNISRVGLNETGSLPANPDTYNPVKLLRGDIERLSEQLAERDAVHDKTLNEHARILNESVIQIKDTRNQCVQLIKQMGQLIDCFTKHTELLEQINRQASKHYANLTIRSDNIADVLTKTHELLVQATQPEDAQDSEPAPDIEQIDSHINDVIKKNSAALIVNDASEMNKANEVNKTSESVGQLAESKHVVTEQIKSAESSTPVTDIEEPADEDSTTDIEEPADEEDEDEIEISLEQ